MTLLLNLLGPAIWIIWISHETLMFKFWEQLEEEYYVAGVEALFGWLNIWQNLFRSEQFMNLIPLTFPNEKIYNCSFFLTVNWSFYKSHHMLEHLFTVNLYNHRYEIFFNTNIICSFCSVNIFCISWEGKIIDIYFSTKF